MGFDTPGDQQRQSVRLAGRREVRPADPMPLGVNERRRGAGSTRPAPMPNHRDGVRPRPRAAGPQAAPSPRAQGAPARGTSNRSARTAQSAPRSRTGRPANPPRGSRGAQGQTRGGSPRRRPTAPRRGGYTYVRNNRIFTHNRWSDRLRNPRVIVALIAVLAVGLGAFGIVTSMQRHAAEVAAQEQAAAEKKRLAAQYVRPTKLGITALAASTPREEWRQGVMPHLYQIDPAWANKPYAGGTIRANACGPTSLAMVYVYLTGRTDMDPASMSAFADQNNFAPTGATEWAFMTTGANMLGINSMQIHPTRRDIANALSAGHPVICSVRPGDFTSVGHFIVLNGIDDNGTVEVFDPNSPFNSARPWDIRRILNQTNACWSFWI